jgi:hypothetical protein
VSNVQVTCSTSTFSVGGSITGLTGSGLVLQNNGADDLSVAANATSFEFATAVAFGATSVVTIESQPAGQSCSVSNGAATVDSNITNVAIACTTIITHALSVSAGANGAIAPDGAVAVNDGASQSFTATPDPGWAVDQWLVDGVPVQAGGSVYALANVTADLTVQVTFARATLVSSTAALALNAGGVSRQIAITNTGSVPATNVLVTYPTWPVGTVASTSCGSTLAAGSSCTITIAPGAVATSNCGTGSAPTSDVIDVAADNASTTSVGAQVLTYGCRYQGGFLATIDDTTPATSSIGGSIAAAADVAIPLEWGGGAVAVGSTSTTDGAANTAMIFSALGSNGGTPYAAQGCYNLADAGYADWYLPARDEMMDLYLNLSPVAAAGISASGFYWSSTEQSPILAKAVGAGGASYDASKFMAFRVRCVRRVN